MLQDAINTFAEPLAGLSQRDWLKRLAAISDEHGYFQPLGKAHFAAFVESGDTLFVTFETMQGIRALDEDAQPLGWEMVKAVGWSHLAVVSAGDTWFRDELVYSYFDQMVDDGFFDEFDQVIFYGAGPCAYAACAFSVVAPGATVVAIQPQATLDPEHAGWDTRFSEERRRDFTSRYGYAPSMIEAAGQVYVIYDPLVGLDAMHAALFTGSHVTRLKARHLGTTVQTHLIEMQILYRILAQAGADKLTVQSFSKLLRRRRDYIPYLRKVLSALEMQEREDLIETLCRNVTARLNAPRFLRRLKQIDAQRLGHEAE